MEIPGQVSPLKFLISIQGLILIPELIPILESILIPLPEHIFIPRSIPEPIPTTESILEPTSELTSESIP